MNPVTVIDYGASDQQSVQQAFESLGAPVVMARTPQEVLSAKALVLTGEPDFDSSLLEEIGRGEEAYFAHSYEARPFSPKDLLAVTVYGERRICAAARRGNVTGCQFRPERSGKAGMSVIHALIDAIN